MLPLNMALFINADSIFNHSRAYSANISMRRLFITHPGLRLYKCTQGSNTTLVLYQSACSVSALWLKNHLFLFFRSNYKGLIILQGRILDFLVPGSIVMLMWAMVKAQSWTILLRFRKCAAREYLEPEIHYHSEWGGGGRPQRDPKDM